jgi:hypothetical protein
MSPYDDRYLVERPTNEYRPPSKRRLQVEAWGIVLTFLIVSWCFVGGVVLGVQMLLTLANALFR